MSRFFDLLEESVVMSGVIALSCVGAVVYLACTGQPIPDLLANITLTVVAFFFGGKVQQAQNALYRKMKG